MLKVVLLEDEEVCWVEARVWKPKSDVFYVRIVRVHTKEAAKVGWNCMSGFWGLSCYLT